MALPSGAQKIDAVLASLARAYGRTVSLEEVPVEWLPQPLASLVNVTRQGEPLATVSIGPRDVVGEPVIFDRQADVLLWLQSSTRWQVSEDVWQPDDDVEANDEEGEHGQGD